MRAAQKGQVAETMRSSRNEREHKMLHLIAQVARDSGVDAVEQVVELLQESVLRLDKGADWKEEQAEVQREMQRAFGKEKGAEWACALRTTQRPAAQPTLAPVPGGATTSSSAAVPAEKRARYQWEPCEHCGKTNHSSAVCMTYRNRLQAQVQQRQVQAEIQQLQQLAAAPMTTQSAVPVPVHMPMLPPPQQMSYGAFVPPHQQLCYGCGQMGHKRTHCPNTARTAAPFNMQQQQYQQQLALAAQALAAQTAKVGSSGVTSTSKVPCDVVQRKAAVPVVCRQGDRVQDGDDDVVCREERKYSSSESSTALTDRPMASKESRPSANAGMDGATSAAVQAEGTAAVVSGEVSVEGKGQRSTAQQASGRDAGNGRHEQAMRRKRAQRQWRNLKWTSGGGRSGARGGEWCGIYVGWKGQCHRAYSIYRRGSTMCSSSTSSARHCIRRACIACMQHNSMPTACHGQSDR